MHTRLFLTKNKKVADKYAKFVVKFEESNGEANEIQLCNANTHSLTHSLRNHTPFIRQLIPIVSVSLSKYVCVCVCVLNLLLVFVAIRFFRTFSTVLLIYCPPTKQIWVNDEVYIKTTTPTPTAALTGEGKNEEELERPKKRGREKRKLACCLSVLFLIQIPWKKNRTHTLHAHTRSHISM